MTENETSEPSSDPFEEVYRAYVLAMKEYWANVDVEAVVRQGRPQGPIHPMNTWAGCFAAPGCSGTSGTYGTYGTYGTMGTHGISEDSDSIEDSENTPD